jgi:hypothetical protein
MPTHLEKGAWAEFGQEKCDACTTPLRLTCTAVLHIHLRLQVGHPSITGRLKHLRAGPAVAYNNYTLILERETLTVKEKTKQVA